MLLFRKESSTHARELSLIETLESRVLLSADDLDPAFNHGALVNTQFPGGSSVINDVATLPDGSILAAGTLSVIQGNELTGENKLLLAKYRFDGSLDPNFGIGGIIENTPRGMNLVSQIALTPDGGFVVMGNSWNPSTGQRSQPLILKFTKTGKLDRSFGNNALVKTENGTFVAVDPQGRLLVGGSRDHPGTPSSSVGVDAVLHRYTASGALDTTFNNNTGEFLDSVGTVGEADSAIKIFRSAAFDKQGRIIVAEDYYSTFGGDVSTNGLAFQIERMFRFSDSGVVDPSYGQADIGGHLRSIAGILDDGSVLLFGQNIAKVDPTGKQLDASYGNDGIANTTKQGPFPGPIGRAAVSPDGSMIFADAAPAGTLELTRLTAQGQTDTTFGTAGTKIIAQDNNPDATDYLDAVDLAPDGSVVFAGQTGYLSPPPGDNDQPSYTFTADTQGAVIGRVLDTKGPAVQLVPRVLQTSSPSLYVTLIIHNTDAADLTTLDDDDLHLIDPQGGSRRLRFVSSQDVNGDGTYIMARYRISGPNGAGWTSDENGVYQVRLAAKQIADTNGHLAMGQALGTVVVKIM